jgi:hypothetical protein
MTIKTVSAVMKKIENRTRGETANMATVPAGYPRPPRVTRHIRIRAGLYLVLLGLELCAVDSNLGHLFPVNFFDYVYSPV